MKASLLIPCFNAAHVLPRLWETIRAQSLPFAEILCYDDASTDDTVLVAERLGARVIRGERNLGVAQARNTLWRAAAHDWVHFHDADDLLHPEFLAKMAAAATVGPSDVVICDARWEFEASRELEIEWRYEQAALDAAPLDYLIAHPVGGINGLYRKAALARIQGFDTSLAIWEDADLHVRLAASGASFRIVPEFLVTALRSPHSLSSAVRKHLLCRRQTLAHYARALPASTHPCLQRELEGVARQFLRLGDTAAARETLRLIPAGRPRSPLSENLLINLCKQTLGPLPALRLQAFFRRT